MAKGRQKRLTSTKVKADDAPRIAEKGTKENQPEMNGDVLYNGQSVIQKFFTSGKSRSPLHDKSLPLGHEGKVSVKQVVQSETDRQAEVRPNNVKSEAAATARRGGHDDEGEKCLPCRTDEPQPKESQGEASSATTKPGPASGCAARRRVRPKKSSLKTAERKEIQNRKVTDYYPIRRSSRKSKSELKCKEQQRINHLIKNGIEEGMQVKHIEGKGRGVFAERSFQKGEYVVEYHGDLLQINDAREREAAYAQDPSTGCYMYYFQYLSKTYCVDATKETNRLGRLINHSKTGNCQTKLHNINGIPHLILVASRDIEKGEELLYDYGDRSKDSIAAHPWLKH
ncbi:N-lysine methyltransferase KMT5A-A [Brienomyrus brachyistius]|uniref:N-lysine methyltransferase KMT5A-A n=1 Tax=Brienomyrus brachyistius TaxID=42636 RepID=UPI0020B19CC7|nr:N-lysine methyltransferase KMT5A-A [Brienomyrus brachyistius]